ncbi:hypothetical protein TVAG_324550 [Trichomonas vaginalis G3]|uniref:Transmembrane protein n=1 Tax=Trichomonas vaginalis (strain ATCC PRA-98 / G3) TaxID=412133 RepID=A2FFQ6_TRIV3|nr:hypothetical protein TVAGG3_0489600 [Trichomonas vaginalis G3]EAX96281.1 hypothetical protein TVAG_324550 [Trichomonas vaginalis G3]KAI5516284.1 hypothetical protein TVAGG3_0489600 [Trichomonas vaginalis G3]|eukprot:XP_001309211.1 hypothetical protein [Trichomonas vaginalis G3]
MTQWKLRSLVILVVAFLAGLILFNAGAYLMGPKIQALPFTPTNRGYSIKVSNISFISLPVFIESYPLVDNTSYLSILCGEEAKINDNIISLTSEYNIGLLTLCKDMTVEVWPRNEKCGFWLKRNQPLFSFTVIFFRIIFLGIVGVTFYLLFSHNKNFSIMRSTLITQISCLLILDPIQLIYNFIPSISIIHNIISALGWWRASAELFAEYAPLVRTQYTFYRNVMIAPSVILLFTTVFQGLCRYSFPNFMFLFGMCGFLVVPVLSTWFLFKAGSTSGKFALTIHIMSGMISLSVAYLMKILRNFNDDFRESILSETLEISFIGAYALFQTIFQTGESKDESARLLPQAVNRYDKIDELLDVLGEIGDDARFEADPANHESDEE